MLTDAGPKVIEFNVRLGDPEAQVVLSRIDEPLLPLLVAGAAGQLRQATCRLSSERLVGVVLASRGYPESSQSGCEIEGVAEAEQVPGVSVFHAGTALHEGRLVTAGGADSISRKRLVAHTMASGRSRSTGCSTGGISDERRCEVLRHHLRLPRESG